MFSFIEKFFTKFRATSQFQPFSWSLGLIFENFARNKSVGMLFKLRGLEKCFLI